MPLFGVGFDRVLGHGQHDDRDAETRLVELLDEVQALDPALEQRVDQDDVRPELLDLPDGLAAVGEHVEQLHLGLGVQQAADVLGDLRHVFDDQQACLVTRCHPARRYHAPGCTKSLGGPVRSSRRRSDPVGSPFRAWPR